MKHAVRGLGLAATLALVSSLAVRIPAGAQSTSAYVYVQSQGPAGPVYEYNANSNGQLTPISGSPFKPGTQIVGGNGTQFFTLGHTLLHSYAVGANGAIGSQLSTASLFNYSGSSCGGTTDGDDAAVMDPSGKVVDVLLEYGGNWSCAAYQTYKANSDGSFTFIGDTEEQFGDQSGAVNPASSWIPSLLGNQTFGYAQIVSGHNSGLIGFKRLSSGELQLIQFNETDPTLDGSAANYSPGVPAAATMGNYVVLPLYPYDSGSPQLGVYTVDAQGNLTTTNTSSNMPTAPGDAVAFSPSGQFVASYLGAGTGVWIYKFNGAAPLTYVAQALNDGSTSITGVAWDSSNHLYAISRGQNKLYMFTVTATSITQDAVVPLTSPVGIVAVSQTPSTGTGACAAPSSNGVNVCAPANGATVSSPVQISAAATVSGGVYRFELWNGSTKLASVDNGAMNTSVSLAPGTYKLTFDAYNSGKTSHEYATSSITVK